MASISLRASIANVVFMPIRAMLCDNEVIAKQPCDNDGHVDGGVHADHEVPGQWQPASGPCSQPGRSGADRRVSSFGRCAGDDRAARARLVSGVRPAAAQSFLQPDGDVRRQLRLSLGPEPVDGPAPRGQGAPAPVAGHARARRCRAGHRLERRDASQGVSGRRCRARRHRSDGVEICAVLHIGHPARAGLLQPGEFRTRIVEEGAHRHLDRDVLRPRGSGRASPARSRRFWPSTASGTSSRATCRRCCG